MNSPFDLGQRSRSPAAHRHRRRKPDRDGDRHCHGDNHGSRHRTDDRHSRANTPQPPSGPPPEHLTRTSSGKGREKVSLRRDHDTDHHCERERCPASSQSARDQNSPRMKLVPKSGAARQGNQQPSVPRRGDSRCSSWRNAPPNVLNLTPSEAKEKGMYTSKRRPGRTGSEKLDDGVHREAHAG